MRSIGVAQRAIDMMARRAKSRFTQGSLLADKQLIQEFVADSYVELTQFRLLVLYAAWLVDTQGEHAAREASPRARSRPRPCSRRSDCERSRSTAGSA